MTQENQTLADRAVVLQEIQPGLLGLMDGSVSTLAPIFATAGLTGRPLSAFFVGLAASLGAAVSMGLSEALSDDGSVTGRGGPLRRGASNSTRGLIKILSRLQPLTKSHIRLRAASDNAQVAFHSRSPSRELFAAGRAT
jgi:hypothetical protein